MTLSKRRYAKTLLLMNLRELGSLRYSTLLQAAFMLINNLIFFVFWIILYENIDQIRGIRIEDMAYLFSVTAGAFGSCVLFFGGSMTLSELISKGALDVYLTQPRDPHFQALTSKTLVAGLGDVISAFFFLTFYFGFDPLIWSEWAFTSVLGAFIFAASFSLFHSLIFWLPRSEQISQQLFEFLITFSLYPPSIFPGPVRVLTYTLLPAAFIAYLPMLARRDASPELLLICLFAALTYILLARIIFRAGLKRYASGSGMVQSR